jgi:hypothetical protein
MLKHIKYGHDLTMPEGPRVTEVNCKGTAAQVTSLRKVALQQAVVVHLSTRAEDQIGLPGDSKPLIPSSVTPAGGVAA